MNAKSILIVDDDPGLCKTLSGILKLKGYIPTTAATGKAALKSIEVEMPVVALIDLRLGDMSGLELLKQVRKRSPNTECIVLTGHATQASAIEAINLGAYSYVQKPYEMEHLLVTIRRAIEKQETVEALRNSEKKFSVAFRSNPGAVTISSLPDDRFIDVNDSFLRLSEYRREEAIGHTSLELNLWDRAEQRDQFIQALQQQWVVRNVEFIFRRKSGDLGIGLLSAELIDLNDQTCVLTMIHDITERKRAEKALEDERASLAQKVAERTAELRVANAELARAAKLKDEFLANMSHELRTPLSAILGMSEVLQEEVYGALNARQLRSLRTIEESGRHLLALINDILDLSKIEAGKVELEIASVYVEPVCQASLLFIKQIAMKKHLKMSSVFDSKVTTIRADERRLKQILVNLLTNAVKFTPEGGAIGLEVEADAEHHMVRFIVWDTGIGIPQDSMNRLFQPFVQLDSSLSRKHGGTGLGLSLVYRMVDMHGGSISVESEVDKGSRFTVSLPWKERPTPSPSQEGNEPTPSPSQEGNYTPLPPSRGESVPPTSYTPQPATRNSQPATRTILIAEDHEDNLQTMSEYLLMKGYRLIVARDGKEAVMQTKTERPDLILMDIQMPEMTGLEAIRRIRENEETKAIPIIALTALVMPGDREKCLAVGANEHFGKPVSLQELHKVIKRFLSSIHANTLET